MAFAGWIDVVPCIQDLVAAVFDTIAVSVVKFGLESNKVRVNRRRGHTYMAVLLESEFQSPFWNHWYSDWGPSTHRYPTSL